MLHIAHSAQRPPTSVFHASGDLDIFGALALRRCLHRSVEGGSTDLVVDLHRVDFVDGSGLSVLARAWADLRLGGAETRVSRSSHSFDRLSNAAGLGHYFRDDLLPVG